MKVPVQLILLTGVLLFSTFSASADRFNINLKGSCSLQGQSGKIVKESVSNTVILNEFAGDNDVNASELALIFDSDVMAILIVRRSNGEELGRVLNFEEISTVKDISELQEVIHLLVRSPEDESNSVRGSGVLALKHTRNATGGIAKTKLSGDFHFSHPETETDGAEVCVFKVTTTSMFVPLAN